MKSPLLTRAIPRISTFSEHQQLHVPPPQPDCHPGDHERLRKELPEHGETATENY